MGIRDRIKRAQRAASADTVLLECPECAQQFRVAEDTDLDFIAYDWLRTAGSEPHHLPTPPDVLLLAEHPHPVKAFVNKGTGLPWLACVEEAGGPVVK